MTRGEILSKIDEIEQISKRDDAEAHRLEDELHIEFIEYVAQCMDTVSLGEKARLIHATESIDFIRWFA